MEIDFPCKCGHEKLYHPESGRNNYIICEGCFRKAFPSGGYDKCCKKYTPDNLKYLEQKYEALHG